MAIFDIFSKRQKVLRGEVPDIYVYDQMPINLRIQIVHILNDALGTGKWSYPKIDAFESIHKILCREYGIFSLAEGYNESDKNSVINFFLKTNDIEKVIDIIELSFRVVDRVIRELQIFETREMGIIVNPDDAVAELNHRFRESGFGYQFEGGEMIKVDSTIMHSEIVKPTLNLLWNKKFKGANEEYIKAHEHYRHGRNKECLSECLKAFESVMKIICKEKGWSFAVNDTSKKLIQICFQNNLVPTFTQNQFTSLQNLLESGIPTIRNKLGGHGQGQIPQKVDDEMTRYALNLTGANIIFLVEQSGIN